jgi:hypothetical protein
MDKKGVEYRELEVRWKNGERELSLLKEKYSFEKCQKEKLLDQLNSLKNSFDEKHKEIEKLRCNLERSSRNVLDSRGQSRRNSACGGGKENCDQPEFEFEVNVPKSSARGLSSARGRVLQENTYGRNSPERSVISNAVMFMEDGLNLSVQKSRDCGEAKSQAQLQSKQNILDQQKL